MSYAYEVAYSLFLSFYLKLTSKAVKYVWQLAKFWKGVDSTCHMYYELACGSNYMYYYCLQQFYHITTNPPVLFSLPRPAWIVARFLAFMFV